METEIEIMEEMETEIEIMEEMEAVEDGKILLSQINNQTRDSLLKRMCLMSIKLDEKDAQLFNKLHHYLPESLLREDDIFYEFLKNHISGESKRSNSRKELEMKEDEDESFEMLFSSQRGLREVFGMLDDMKTRALCCFAQILTGGSDSFVKTKFNMIRFIKERLQAGFNDKSSNRQQKILQMSKFLRDPNNYHGKFVPHMSPSKYYRAAALRILNEIDNFPTQALRSMYRKLKSVNGYTPQIRTKRSGRSHGELVEHVRKKCLKFLSELGEEGSLPLPLAYALAVASLAVKLKSTSASLPKFRTVTVDIDNLQNDIMKAIWLLEDEMKLSFTEVNDLLLLLNPTEQTNKNIRISIRNLMTEYLFECADMDIIPECLREALSFINERAEKVSCSTSSKEEDTEVEGVLALSSQAKQVIWDYIPECENDIDIEFANAYLDDMLDSDDEYFSNDNNLDNQIEGFGESMPSCLTSPFNTDIREDSTEDGDGILENKYLSIQKACDNSSTIAYDLIGGLLNKFAAAEGLDLEQDQLSYLRSEGVASSSSERELLSSEKNDDNCSLVHVLKEQIQSKRMPSLSDSAMEKLKKIMM